MLDLRDPKFDRFGNINTLKSLIDLIKNNSVIPFVGAGMSIDIYGSWGTALERIMDGHIFGQKAKHIKELIISGRYETAATEIEKLLGEICYQDQVVAVFGETVKDDILKEMSVRYLPRIFRNSLVVTTNFDKVLERVFLMEQYAFEEKVALRHLSKWQARNTQLGSLHYLIKIHGCISAPDEVVITEESYNELYEENPNHIERLRKILEGNHLLFIGCGLKEDRTVDLLRKVGFGNHYAILGMNGEAEDDVFHDRKLSLSQDLQMHCIWYPKGEHHYVEDILQYIYADITGQLKEGAITAPDNPQASRSSSSTPSKEPVEAPQLTMKPLVKNETYTLGHWNKKPMEWLILDVQPDRALLIAKDCLMKAPYNEEYGEVTWENCTLRNKLLPDLLEGIFDETERSKVMLVNNKNPKNDYFKTPGAAESKDELFLLSIDEAKQYFPYDQARIASLNGEAVWWWLRFSGYYSRGAASVSTDGRVDDGGIYVSWAGGAVRPAFWLNLQS